MRTLDEIMREAIQGGATLREIQETAIREALFHYCSVARAAKALGWTWEAVSKRRKALGITIPEMRKIRAAQRNLPLQAPATRTKAATNGL